MTYEVECDACEGTGDSGSLLFNRPCSDCGGRGVTEKMEPWELEEEEFQMEERSTMTEYAKRIIGELNQRFAENLTRPSESVWRSLSHDAITLAETMLAELTAICGAMDEAELEGI